MKLKFTDLSGSNYHHLCQHPQFQQQQHQHNGTLLMPMYQQQQQHISHFPLFIPPTTTATISHLNMDDLTHLNSLSVTLSAETLAGVRLNESPLTCLNQGQSYEIKFKKHIVAEDFIYFKSNIRLMFHDRRHQHSEEEQFQTWLASKADQRLLDLDVPLSVNTLETKEDPRTPNMITITWTGHNEASVSIKINCISTEFTAKKHGGEKGVPFRLQVDTYAVMDEEEPDGHLIQRSYCLIKVFKPNGADRKNKTSRIKMSQCPVNEKDQYHPSLKTTSLKEVNSHEISMFSPVKWSSSDKRNEDKRSVTSISSYSSHSNHLTYSDDDMLYQEGSNGNLNILPDIEDKVTSSSNKHNSMMHATDQNDVHHANHTATEVDDSLYLDVHFVAKRLQHSVLQSLITNNDGSTMLRMTNSQLIDLLRLTTYFDTNKLQDEPLKTIYITMKDSSDGSHKSKPSIGSSSNAKLVLTDNNHNNIAIPQIKKQNKRSLNDDDDENNHVMKKFRVSEDLKCEEQTSYSGIHLHCLTKQNLVQQICHVFNLHQQSEVSNIYIVPKENVNVKVTDEEVRYLKNHSTYHLNIETDQTSGGKNWFLVAI